MDVRVGGSWDESLAPPSVLTFVRLNPVLLGLNSNPDNCKFKAPLIRLNNNRDLVYSPAASTLENLKE